MSVRLQLENGEVREYTTWGPGGEWYHDYPTRYETMCGMRCYEETDEGPGCDHIDCAIAANRNNRFLFLPFTFMPAIIGVYVVFDAVILLIDGSYDGVSDLLVPLGFGGFFLLFGISGIFAWYCDYKTGRELVEFRDRGTVNGIRAEQI